MESVKTQAGDDTRIVTENSETAATLVICRKVFRQKTFDETYGVHSVPSRWARIQSYVHSLTKSVCTWSYLLHRLSLLCPLVGVLSRYKLPYVPRDIIAGLTVGIMHIPQGIYLQLQYFIFICDVK
jgi:hypothetical protein